MYAKAYGFKNRTFARAVLAANKDNVVGSGGRKVERLSTRVSAKIIESEASEEHIDRYAGDSSKISASERHSSSRMDDNLRWIDARRLTP